MSIGFQAALAFLNLADLGQTLLRASSSAPFLPVQMLRDPHIGRVWRAGDAAPSLFLDFQSPRRLDTVALMGCNMGAGGSIRVRGSLSDSTAESDVLFDEVRVGACDPALGYQPLLLDGVREPRFLRVDLAEPGLSFIQAARLFAGERHAFEVNFSYGWSQAWVDPSVKTKSAGGSTFVDRKRRFRVIDLSFEHIPEDQRWGFIDEADRTRGASEDVLLISHPADPDVGARMIWGLNVDTTPTVESFFRRFAKQYRIEERL